ncbi:flagellar motor switch phosphatase FliY [Pelosinus propionicus]|uniref:Flagellar motor switch protein FliN/FliY n=1 Tax=Pelosinus propionicus DSM 13327 TaxID=1123291 RepID=A0A1I4K1A6_9FIRM|nr:flagellar motor switch phosphatase FliY [Pelosinus propionicus]SFL72283.1 flagellar motor switch protein FliN/FliY [Pelosinus propionicus DSM 13327]
MTEGFLSQDEIDALLRGEATSSSPAPELSAIEQDALGEIGNISMGSAATTLSVLLGRRVSITTPRVSVSNLEEIKGQYPLPYLVIEVGYTHGIVGTNVLAIREQDALIIADLMMGGDGLNPPTELNELYMSAVSEAMNQMMGGVATSMSTMFRKKIDIAPPNVNLIDFAVASSITNAVGSDDNIVRVAFRMEVEDLIDSEIMQILPIDVSKEMVDSLMNAVQPPAAAPVTESPKVAETSSSQAQTAKAQQQVAAASVAKQHIQPVNVQPVQFAPLVQGTMPVSDTNIDLIMDVPLQVTVELGRTRKLIRDILELAPGSVVELDKLAGEPVDILVNGKLIAKGEVVVIDENFGVRITDIISPLERTYSLQ